MLITEIILKNNTKDFKSISLFESITLDLSSKSVPFSINCQPLSLKDLAESIFGLLANWIEEQKGKEFLIEINFYRVWNVHPIAGK